MISSDVGVQIFRKDLSSLPTDLCGLDSKEFFSTLRDNPDP